MNSHRRTSSPAATGITRVPEVDVGIGGTLDAAGALLSPSFIATGRCSVRYRLNEVVGDGEPNGW